MSKQVKNRGMEPYWKQVELAVAMVEMVLDPDARVEHNVRLWEHKAKELVQCDVVIRRGIPSRETVTIVEVQARKEKVNRAMFDHWCIKRDNVGAQHLICVSERGFERPVLASAREQGNAVRLVTFKKVPLEALPVTFENGQFKVVVPKITVMRMGVMTEGMKAPGAQFEWKDVEFHLNSKPTTVADLFKPYNRSFSPPAKGEVVYTERLVFDSDEVVTMTWPGESARVLFLTKEIKATSEEVLLPLSSRAYFQLEYEGTLAWYTSGTGLLDGETAAMHLIMTKKADGQIDLTTIATEAFCKLPIDSMDISFTKPMN